MVMASKIRVLDELTINQIAAGEVIENPSSVVKELVENALDAGSTEITIEIKTGGRQLIRVTDNGCGMSRDDALLCIERHATSKLKRFDDLSALMTMGFRGEALPSVASISQFQLTTRTAGQQEELGTMLIVEGGRILKCTTCPRAIGTTIEVKNLFYNVPVRRKFQKSPTYDANEILKSVTALSLAHPDIRFELISDNKTQLSTPGNLQGFLEALKLRARDALGSEFVEELIPLSREENGYKVEGYFSLPFHHRPNRQSQFLFVNGRFVSSTLVSLAARDGYGPSMPPNRYPAFVLHLNLPCDEFDINVHPQKKEVRFRREDKLKEFITRSFENALQGNLKTPIILNEEIFKEFESGSPSFSFQYASYTPAEKEKTFSLPFKNVVEEKPLQLPKMALKPLCIASFKDYIVLENAPEHFSAQDGICLIQKNHAYARILYERALKSLNEQQGAFGSQALLIPVTIELVPEDAAVLRLHLQAFGKLGFEIREFGQHTFFIESLPEHLNSENGEEVIRKMVAVLKDGEGGLSWQKGENQKIALAAAKSVQKKGLMSVTEAQQLVNQLLDCQQPYFSPNGQPVFAFLNEEILKNLFKK
ncbi:DNA mismatch repair protein MutL [Chlamydiales bacterium STE3]|nr:DNA mismatch repair protein MutL [Chlamydiales bacterium STE3]